jgi:hypothetical protein
VYISRKVVLGLLLGVLVAGSLVFALGASGQSPAGADRGGNTLLRSTLAPSDPAPADPAFHGITPGGVPWVLKRSSIELKADGKLDLRVEGLVIPGDGTPGPVKTVSASLLCGPDSQTGATATTGQVPLSAGGDARIEARLTLPASCLAPIVVVHPNGNTGAYIAITGWKS